MATSTKKSISELLFQEDIRYYSEHTWVRVEGDTIKVGISDFAQDQLGDIIFFELPSCGERFSQGQSFGSVESVKVVSTLYMPVSGEVIAINGELESNPELANRDPYGAGWIMTIKPEDDSLANLLTRQEYKKMLTEGK